MKKIFVFTLLLMVVMACGSHKKTTTGTQTVKTVKPVVKEKKDSVIPVKEVKTIEADHKTETTETVVIIPNKSTQEYIDKYAPIAMQKMKDHRIPASITLAQGILESGSGNSTLASKANNHFGIKCHKEWNGERFYQDDDEKNECFRVYPHAEGSFEDHSQFLTTRSRYADLFKLPQDDYSAWAFGLKNAGYATDKKYPQKLIGFIEKYELYKYDNQVLGKSDSADNDYYIVQKGDNLFSIASKFNLNVAQLKMLNNLTSDDVNEGKRLKIIAVVNKNDELSTAPNKSVIAQDTLVKTNQVELSEKHMVQKGETLYSIAKKYNLSVENLMLWNSLSQSDLSEGQTLLLKPTNITTVIEISSLKIPEYHIVSKGETLYQIAYKYGLEIPDIRKWNNIKKDEISIGQQLKLSSGISNTPDISKTYIVQKGDTLFSIAKKNNTTIEQLIQWNNIVNQTVVEGQVLKLVE